LPALDVLHKKREKQGNVGLVVKISGPHLQYGLVSFDVDSVTKAGDYLFSNWHGRYSDRWDKYFDSSTFDKYSTMATVACHISSQKPDP